MFRREFDAGIPSDVNRITKEEIPNAAGKEFAQVELDDWTPRRNVR
jgi:hypothetical protein